MFYDRPRHRKNEWAARAEEELCREMGSARVERMGKSDIAKGKRKEKIEEENPTKMNKQLCDVST
jgi:hypothetical protein